MTSFRQLYAEPGAPAPEPMVRCAVDPAWIDIPLLPDERKRDAGDAHKVGHAIYPEVTIRTTVEGRHTGQVKMYLYPDLEIGWSHSAVEREEALF